MQVTKETNIVDLINYNRGAAVILMQHGMHCVGCLVAHNENLEQACAVHGIDVDELVSALNDYLKMVEEDLV